MPDEVDRDLELARSGDREALDRMLERCENRLRSLSRGLLGSGLRAKIDVSDILQSAYLEVVRDIREFRGRDERTFMRWLGSILENNIRGKGRYFAARKRKNPESSGEVREKTPSDPPAPTPTPSTEVRRVEDLVLAGEALENLPEEQRRVILLRVVEGKSHREIAEEIDKSEGATRMLLSRARAALSLEIERLERS